MSLVMVMAMMVRLGGWVRGEPRCKLLPSGAIPNPRVCAHNMPRNRDYARDHHDEASAIAIECRFVDQSDKCSC